MSREYNPATDAYYDPNSMSDVYLSEQQLAAALQAITDKSAEGKAVAELIETSETLRRQMFEGYVTQSDYSQKIKSMQKKFVKDFGLWAFQTSVHQEFYSVFGDIER